MQKHSKKEQFNYINNVSSFSFISSFFFTFKSLASYIKKIRTGDPNESDITYWMFSYDFKSPNKDWVPENKNLLWLKKEQEIS